MKLSASERLALIREYKNQGGRGNYLSVIKQYEDGGDVDKVSTSVPYEAVNPWKQTIPTPKNKPTDLTNPTKIDITPKKFLSDYINSPKYTERLKNMGYLSPEETIEKRQNLLKDTKVVYSNTESYYDPIIKKAFVNKKDAVNFNADITDIELHELSHASGALAKTKYFNPGVYGLNLKEEGAINKRNNLYPYIEEYISGKSPFNATKLHDAAPTEFKADMNVLRYNLFKDGIYDAGKSDFTKDILKSAKTKYKNNKEIKRLFDRATDDDLIWLMNNIALNGFIKNQNLIV